MTFPRIPAVGRTIFWLTRSQEDVPAGNAWLGRWEREYQRSLRAEKRRVDFRLGRFTAKTLLLAYSDPSVPKPIHARRLSEFEIVRESSGAPRAEHRGTPMDVSISLSHRGDLALCVMVDGSAGLGCDLEAVEPRSPAFVEDYFTQSEREAVERSNEADRQLATNLIWSAKECALKALGVGLSVDTRSVEVRFDRAARTGSWQPLTVTRVQDGEVFRGRWRTLDHPVLTVITVLTQGDERIDCVPLPVSSAANTALGGISLAP